MVNAMNKKINQALATVKSVAKKSVKVTGALLPAASIGMNIYQAITDNPGKPDQMLRRLIRNYSGVDPADGSFNGDDLMKGTGTLIITGIAGAVISALA